MPLRHLLVLVVAAAILDFALGFNLPSALPASKGAAFVARSPLAPAKRDVLVGAFQMVASGAERNAAKAGRLTRLRMKVSHAIITSVALIGPSLIKPERVFAEGGNTAGVEHAVLASQAATDRGESRQEFALGGGSGRKLVMLAKAAPKETAKDPAVMLSFKDPQTKKTLAALVTAGYAAVWLFFFLTHDAGEVSE